MALESIKYKRGQLDILDQLLLPTKTVYISINDTDDAWNAIKKMQVRGAPAIAIVGCLSLALEIQKEDFSDVANLGEFIVEKLNYLVSSRPTAVNMKEAAVRYSNLVKGLLSDGNTHVEGLRQRMLEEFEKMFKDDVATNRALSKYGGEHILDKSGGENVKILTHCNTGSLASAGYGTALGVVRYLYDAGKLEEVYCTETRPYNQGARLTAYEIVSDKMPGTLICDSMVSMVMTKKKISAVVVGADRVVKNGDTANKIGTYQIAICANYHDIPFYVACPTTSFDPNLSTGDDIVIEERPHVEMTSINNIQIAPEGIGCYNPAFDVTPADLITGGIITEYGVFSPAELYKQLKNLLPS